MAASPTSQPLLRLEHCTMRFGGLTCVSEFTAHIAEMDLVGLIGPNGAGKTTVFNLITGVYQPTGGKSLIRSPPTASRAPSKTSACSPP